MRSIIATPELKRTALDSRLGDSARTLIVVDKEAVADDVNHARLLLREGATRLKIVAASERSEGVVASSTCQRGNMTAAVPATSNPCWAQ